MLSLSVSGLSLASTYSQIETLRRDSNALSKAIAGLAVTTGRSFPSQFEELISEGKYLITYCSNWAPFKYYVSMFLAFLVPPTHLEGGRQNLRQLNCRFTTISNLIFWHIHIYRLLRKICYWAKYHN